jgi:signal transduction histidine kinase
MESFAKPMLATRNISLCLDYKPFVAGAILDMEMRKNLYLIFKEAINNAFKYSGCSEIHTVISKTDQQLNLTIKDNGVGFDVNREMKGDRLSLSGNGLRNMRSRVEEMKGTLLVNSIAGEGTEIKVRIPIP